MHLPPGMVHNFPKRCIGFSSPMHKMIKNSRPKLHSQIGPSWTPVGPQLGQTGVQLDPTGAHMECFLGRGGYPRAKLKDICMYNKVYEQKHMKQRIYKKPMLMSPQQKPSLYLPIIKHNPQYSTGIYSSPSYSIHSALSISVYTLSAGTIR